MVAKTTTDDPDVAEQILPAWFVDRMMSDYWSFGLLLATGQVMAIKCIDEVTVDANGGIWLDVEMDTDPTLPECGFGKAIGSPSDRTKASINAAHVVAAFELADT